MLQGGEDLGRHYSHRETGGFYIVDGVSNLLDGTTQFRLNSRSEANKQFWVDLSTLYNDYKLIDQDTVDKGIYGGNDGQ